MHYIPKDVEYEADASGKQPFQRRYRWVMMALAWAAYGSFGVIARSMGPLITPILKDLGISHTEMGNILGSWPIAYIGVSLIAGPILDRYGIRKPIFLGVMIVGLSAGLRALATGFIDMFFYVFIFGIGGPMLSIGCPKLLSIWFKGKERGTAIGAYMTGPIVGGTFSLALTNSLVMPAVDNNWRFVFIVWAAQAVAIALIWLIFARDVKEKGVAEKGKEKGIGLVQTFAVLGRVRNVQLLLLLGLLAFIIFHGFVDWQPNLLESRGYSPAMAGFITSVSYIVGIASILTVSHFTPPHRRRQMAAFLSIVDAIGMMLVISTSGLPLWLGNVLFGLGKAAVLPLLLLLLMELPEVGPYMGTAGGMFFCVAEIGGWGGPFILGALVDATGTFWTGVLTTSALSILCAIILFTMKIKPTAETQAAPAH